MPFHIVRQDITKMEVDAIVNAANTELKMGGGVCGAIFKAAGAKELQAACDKLAPIKTGEAVITPGFNLPAKYIIHTVGPVYHDGKSNEAELLRASYIKSMELAVEAGCESIAFPLISSGIYGYPPPDALQVAQAAITDFLNQAELQVYLAVFNQEAFEHSQKLLGEVKSYIDQHYVDARKDAADRRRRDEGVRPFVKHGFEERQPEQYSTDLESAEEQIASDVQVQETLTRSVYSPTQSLEERIKDLDEPFKNLLFRLIDDKNKTDVEVYKRANLDRKLFSKIKSNKNYMPGKKTILALAIALELSLDESKTLLERAGYALSSSNLFDVIVEYFIVNGNYNIFAINDVLFNYDLELLGVS